MEKKTQTLDEDGDIKEKESEPSEGKRGPLDSIPVVKFFKDERELKRLDKQLRDKQSINHQKSCKIIFKK